MQPTNKIALGATALYVVLSICLFYYFKAGGYEHASANTLFYSFFLELLHLKDVTASLLLYLLLTGLLLFFILSSIRNLTIRYIIVGIMIVLSLPVLSMWGL